MFISVENELPREGRACKVKINALKDSPAFPKKIPVDLVNYDAEGFVDEFNIWTTLIKVDKETFVTCNVDVLGWEYYEDNYSR